MRDVEKTDAQWREQLGDEAFQVCREKGTEPAFSGRYWDTKTPGTYRCAGCSAPLFDSGAKFDSGSGWPSFYQPVDEQIIEEHRDASHGMLRTEIVCRRCGSHLGHVFEDGPAPTGLRYCVNSASLALEPREQD